MISIGESLKAAALAAWNSKKISGAKPHAHFDLSPEGHLQVKIDAAVTASVDLPGTMDGLAVTALNAAAELGDLNP